MSTHGAYLIGWDFGAPERERAAVVVMERLADGGLRMVDTLTLDPGDTLRRAGGVCAACGERVSPLAGRVVGEPMAPFLGLVHDVEGLHCVGRWEALSPDARAQRLFEHARPSLPAWSPRPGRKWPMEGLVAELSFLGIALGMLGRGFWRDFWADVAECERLAEATYYVVPHDRLPELVRPGQVLRGLGLPQWMPPALMPSRDVEGGIELVLRRWSHEPLDATMTRAALLIERVTGFPARAVLLSPEAWAEWRATTMPAAVRRQGLVMLRFNGVPVHEAAALAPEAVKVVAP